MPKLRRLMEPNPGIPPPPPPSAPPAAAAPVPAARIPPQAFPSRFWNILVVYSPYLWKLVYFLILPILGGVLAVLLAVFRYKVTEYMAEDPLDVCANGMMKTMKIRPSINEDYVHRSLLEKFKWNPTVPRYYVLAGPKGGGRLIFVLIKLFSNCLYSVYREIDCDRSDSS